MNVQITFILVLKTPLASTSMEASIAHVIMDTLKMIVSALVSFYNYYINNVQVFCVFPTDINECVDNNGGCEQVCMNTDGSYNCLCEAGFTPENTTHCDGNDLAI